VAPGAGKWHQDHPYKWRGHSHYWWGPSWGAYYGPWYHGPIFVPVEYPYPYPYLYPDYYTDDYQYEPPCDVWSIETWFDGQLVVAYWDPYIGGYYYFDANWGYIMLSDGSDINVCDANGIVPPLPPAVVDPTTP
jgi:hypothetical protein